MPMAQPQCYTLEVSLLRRGPPQKFARAKGTVPRTIQIRGDQTLLDLHFAIFDAYDRWDEHMYEFQFGERMNDPEGLRYVLPQAFDAGDPTVAGDLIETTLDSLELEVGLRFGYWFDFGDDWLHMIQVKAIDDRLPKGKLPKVIKRVGKSPPQYPDDEDD